MRHTVQILLEPCPGIVVNLSQSVTLTGPSTEEASAEEAQQCVRGA